MKALLLNRYGSPDVLELGALPAPTAKPGEVLVRLAHSGVNPIDLGVRDGRVLPDKPGRFPMVLGWDGAGYVEALGEGVEGFETGQRVMVISKQPSSGIGLHAGYAALPVDQVTPLPDGVSFDVAAATPLAAVTAFDAVEALGLQPGSTIHVNNLQGAVGGFAVQIARALGLKVVDALGPASVDGAIDVVGADAAQRTFAAVSDGGRYATTIPEWWKPGGPYTEARGIMPAVVENKPTRALLDRLAAWLADGTIAPVIEAVLPLERGAEAHARMEAPGLTRKFVLQH